MMSSNKSNGNPNLQSIGRAALTTFLIYISINLIAFGWAVLTVDFSGPIAVKLKNLVLYIDGVVIGLSWQHALTRALLIGIFLAFILGDLLRGRASLRHPGSTADKASVDSRTS